MNRTIFNIVGAAVGLAVVVAVIYSVRNPVLPNDPEGDKPGAVVPSSTETIKIFFSNSELDPEVSCNTVFPVEREIESTPAVARAALNELLKGPSKEEEKDGYFTSINPGVQVRSISIEDGVAKVDFDATIEKNAGGSCRVSAIRAEITKTLMQFPTVRSVIISVEGRVGEALQP